MNTSDSDFEFCKVLSGRIDLLVETVEVLGRLVQIQSERIDRLEGGERAESENRREEYADESDKDYR